MYINCLCSTPCNEISTTVLLSGMSDEIIQAIKLKK